MLLQKKFVLKTKQNSEKSEKKCWITENSIKDIGYNW